MTKQAYIILPSSQLTSTYMWTVVVWCIG